MITAEIDHDGPEPVYRQLVDLLTRRIASGVLRPGRPIPSESRLCQEFGVARGTARKAVQVLRGRGLVETVAGRGTFVVRPATDQRRAGVVPVTETVSSPDESR